jgi:hypothetical protein
MGRVDSVKNSPAEIARLRAMPYEFYLMTWWWAEVRERALTFDRSICQCCHSTSSVLHVHHLTYERRGHEEPWDVVTVCPECHRLLHHPMTCVGWLRDWTDAMKVRRRQAIERARLLDAQIERDEDIDDLDWEQE